MKDKNLLNELNDDEIDTLMKYSMEFSLENDKNIKTKFAQKAAKQRKFTFKRLAVSAVIASAVITSTLVYAQVLDFSRIYRIVFGEKSEYLEQYIEPFVSEVPNEFSEPKTVVENPEELSTPKTVIESEYDGIIFKLISVINDGDALRIFATMQDTTEDRLGAKMDFNRWGLSQGHGGNASVVDYNRETKTATILITSLGEHQEGDTTLNIDGITTGIEYTFDLEENEINLYEILQNHTPQIMSPEKVWVGGGSFQSKEGEGLARNSDLLELDEKNIAFENIDWSYISNIGFVDGHLHIQTVRKSIKKFASQKVLLNIAFVNSENEILYNGHLALMYEAIENSKQDGAYDADMVIDAYREMIYEEITDIEQLKDLSILIGIVEEGEVIEGNWNVSFAVPKKVTTEFEFNREMNINGSLIKIDTVSLSPLGVTINLPDNIASDYKHEDIAYVTYDDGSIVALEFSYIGGYEDTSTIKFSGDIIEVEKVKSININDEVISIE